jgi:hypothetical protein
LTGKVTGTDTTTGREFTRTTDSMPDAVIYKACGNRRSAICPACAEVYRGDAYQLVLAGLAGGKEVPESVSGHPAVFATFTAPGFGIVHTQRRKGNQLLPCRARRKLECCPHGVVTVCTKRHGENDSDLGQPFCQLCYRYREHVIWNNQASELWRRTAQQANRLLARHAKSHGDKGRVRLSFGKAAEYQRRGVVHFHALIRVDGVDPDDPDTVLPPPEWATVFVLNHIVRQAAEAIAFVTGPHSANAEGWLIQWGTQLDIKPLRVPGDAAITDTQVAGYLAKYATKSTDTTGHVSRRITDRSIRLYTDQSHPGRIIATAWELGADPDHESLRRWAHMLGFGGHFFTKSKRYSTTFKALRAARTIYRRSRRQHRPTQLSEQHDEQTTLVINTVDLEYAGMGWHSSGDALLANTAAAMARERRRVTREARAQIEADLDYADIA